MTPPASPPATAVPITDGGKMIPATAPAAMPVQAPCWVGFSTLWTWTLPSSLEMIAASNGVIHVVDTVLLPK